MGDMTLIGQLLLMLLAANGAPIVVRQLLGNVGGWPIDGGYVAADGRRWLGESKTWRGLLSAIVVTAGIAYWLGYPPLTGALLALYSLGGDMVSSFIKRRMGRPPSSRATGLDQIPEAGLPLLLLHGPLDVTPLSGVLVVLIFMLLEISLSKLLYHMHIRKRPY